MPETVVGGRERIAAAFEAARAEGRAAVMPYMMGGFPDHRTSLAVAESYVESGADLIELGVPFSDPLADGPVIHAAATEALGAGANLASVLEVCAAVGDRVPVVLMTYSNMVLGVGPDRFAERAIAAGASGVILPDLPMGEDERIRGALSAAGLAVVPLVAPTTSPERRDLIAGAAQGFIYVVSVVGTTGERSELPAHLTELVEDVRAKASVPVAVGFGIGNPEHVARVGRIADGVIVGTRLVKAVAEAGPEGAAEAVGSFLRDARAALAG